MVFNIAFDHEPLGRVSFELFADKVPMTAGNFCALRTEENGFGYKGSCFHGMIPELMCQGGDLTCHKGTGGKSIDGEKFEDEACGSWHLVHGKCWTQHQRFRFSSALPRLWLDNKRVDLGKVKESINIVDLL
ncbi:peptidyl-prolyl cis-trans isomerase A-like [Myotis myotis]|uniref:peptidyl-prolyl cis-trans isomerase A-like n=1 Tax=Myotis myotis TaxID=51298 RepID=UPI0017489083|nr:peptidyl-prolyl cis-trans isomerase A-like [Myotis myotis]